MRADSSSYPLGRFEPSPRPFLAAFLRRVQLLLFEEDLTGLLSELPREAVDVLYHYVLSEEENFEMVAIAFLKLARSEPHRLFDPLHHIFGRVVEVSRAVKREAHRFKGFLRFREMGCGLLYGAFEPRYQVLPPVSYHFARRMRSERLLIHDTRRGLAVLVQDGRFAMVEVEASGLKPSEGENLFQRLWRSYFHSVAVEERENRRLQLSKVPLRYRRHMTEFSEHPEIREEVEGD